MKAFWCFRLIDIGIAMLGGGRPSRAHEDLTS